ncbi:uncharacterized protein LOC130291184 isoform X1 [Hyla sarda]|uniref:uncharacterized protein LOC130291184 isoform X1 n=1 Tax=Hyla sarda TaxID=327740 RepID=UPI0024C45D97|nr:uncharacterized protein LOC130291184 isoform X1 [Hyla sarda]XP_056395659.1 uncharacterized protein LOC130291184 isoform X1 [Hyla sarda]XP_056395660.1 uncharacterized protein LOC130291184 isoform X1 [Hyla sarda]XP_056395661.1 uncharacterized protein LOC130291184 isoform X1 [Hyla sarda]XP_056395662.1 uncharacterized protein LOC130291184 isoform X1 [Hyla sarda]XP_056395663.1 uncharacterized protein LOC130291184 isoform X1 [Hyla sarda]XP_056395664.1 uncharacterized protein LOC130291184 isoform
MQEQKLWNDDPRGNRQKEKIFWISSSDRHGSSRTPTHLSPIKEKVRDIQPQKGPPNNGRKAADVLKKEKHVELAAVEGATCNLQEKSKNQERASSASQYSIRQKIHVTVGKNEIGEFCPSYNAGVHPLTTGKPAITVHNNKAAMPAPSHLNLQTLSPVQKFGSSTLHLYIPTASYEEEETNTARKKNEAPDKKDSKISKNAVKVEPLKPLVPHSSRRVTEKWTRVPCKEALSTANLSVQFCGGRDSLHASLNRGSLTDNTRQRVLLGENNNMRNPIQRPVSNLGYRLGSYHSDKITENSEYGLNVSTLRLRDEKPKGSYLLHQRRGLDKIESFLTIKREHEMNEEQNSRCQSEPDILDFEKRQTYI